MHADTALRARPMMHYAVLRAVTSRLSIAAIVTCFVRNTEYIKYILQDRNKSLNRRRLSSFFYAFRGKILISSFIVVFASQLQC